MAEATFGGTGIDNTRVCQGTFFNGDLVMGITVTARYSNQAPTDNGINTYHVDAGGDTLNGEPGYLTANIDVFVKSLGGSAYAGDFFYDFDPGFATDISQMGRVHFLLAAGATSQDSINLGFTVLATPIPGVITPPTYGPFDPTVPGEYTFGLSLIQDPVPNGDIPAEAILGAKLLVGDVAVPEVSSLLLAGIGIMGLCFVRRKQ